MKRLVMGTALAALLLSNVTSVAAADPTTVYNKMINSSDPVATWNSLSAAQKTAFKAYETPVTAATTKLAPRLIIGGDYGTCWKRGYKLMQYNQWGSPLFSMTLYTTWCGDGSVISDPSSRVVGETYAGFWSWRMVDKSLSVYRTPNPDRLDSFAQAEFKLCIFSNIGCVMYRYPWIDMDGNATGWHSFSHGGS